GSRAGNKIMSNTVKNNTKLWVISAVVIALVAGLAGYRWINSSQHNNTLKIGISPPYAELLRSVADEVKAQGINVELIEFSDWQAPNVAVQNGDIDANFFQQSVYLRNAIRETNFDLHSFAPGTGSHVGLYT